MRENIGEEQHTDRNYNLDLLKIFACLAVVGMHTLYGNGAMTNLIMCYACTFAIPVFFASSGFILLGRKKIAYRYCIQKVIYIIRIAFVWSFAVELLITVVKLILRKDLSGLSIVLFLKNVTYNPLIQKGNMWQFWYLGALAVLYLFLPLLHRFVKISWRKYLCTWLTFVAICLVFQVISILIGRPVQKYVTQTFRFWTWIQYFGAGGYALFIIRIIGQDFCKASWSHNSSMDRLCDNISVFLRERCCS